MYVVFCFFFFKQKTAYEMRISDWSSDVCSSDLVRRPLCIIDIEFHFHFRALTVVDDRSSAGIQYREIGNRTIRRSRGCNEELAAVDLSLEYILDIGRRSEERRVGKECVSPCRSRWSPYPEKKNTRNITNV